MPRGFPRRSKGTPPNFTVSTAGLIGVSRCRAAPSLGPINYNGHIEVHQSLLNMVLHEKPEIRS